MARIKLTRNGQAAIEMAVLGSLIMVCFSVLLSYAQTFTEQQAIQQQAFRMALRRAYDNNGGASYTIMKHHRTPNIFGNFGQGNRESVSASSTVWWSLGGDDQSAYYQVNENLRTLPTHDGTPEEVWDVESSAETDYSGEESKQEDATQIATYRRGDISDTITTVLKTQHDSAPDNEITIVQGLCANGRYAQSCEGDTIGRERTWETPH